MKKIIQYVAAGLIVTTLAGCTGNGSDSTLKDQKGTSTSQSNLNPAGFPIVKDKITLRAVSMAQGGADWGKMEFFKKLEEQTNIHVEFEIIDSSNPEKINLMFASRDFPDLIFNGPNDSQVMQASTGGDIIPLDELIAKYAPNWTKGMNQNPYIKKIATMSDGKIYGLPFVKISEVETGIRDQIVINTAWLSELGLKKPKTTEEFYQVLKAFKDNAGKGTIPKNVIPWYFRFNEFVGGQLDIFGSFGVYAQNNDFLDVRGGKVSYEAMNPAIKEPIKYLQRLYKEGLIPTEVFTDDNNTYLAKTRSNPPVAGVYGGFYNTIPQLYEPMAPLKSQVVEKPLFRRQLPVVTRNKFMITKSNKHPEASMRWIDALADADWSVQGQHGMFGKYLEKQPDGKIKQTDVPADKIFLEAPSNAMALLGTEDIYNGMIYAGIPKGRADAIKEYYKDYTVPVDRIYPPVIFTPQQLEKLKSLETDIKGFVSQSMARWITEGGVDAGWDAYIQKLKEMKVDELIQIRQEALDAFNKSGN
jgi:putative aldouronate transport system substrate-binding protein